ncbi:MAG: DUF559 domain-containing protein [Novosphingobium sp.]|nr:DUF559 domain-containing protein [Novosphingobium sp.]
MRQRDNDYAKARRLRRKMTLPEVLLWREVRRRAGGVKFRRQHAVEKYVIDFYCAEAKLGIEVDGIVHNMGDQPQHDEKRDAVIAGHGIGILRIPAKDVLLSPIEMAEAVVAACRDRMGC